MNMHESFAPFEAVTSNAPAAARSSRLRLVRARLVAWAKTCADNNAAAVAYENLSRLSDAELKHRGLSRDILAHGVSEGCARPSGK